VIGFFHLFFRRFSINDTSGVITVASDLDRENVNSYRLTVKAADRGTPSQFSSREVLITVTDVNDNDPIFTADPYRGNIAEDASVGSPVVQVFLCQFLYRLQMFYVFVRV
jgi:hypothetical protein